MQTRREKVTITTDGAGAGSGSTPVMTGRIIDIQYVPNGSTPYDNTVDLTAVTDVTGRSVLSKSNIAAAFVAAPRQPTHDTSGAALLYAAGGAAVCDHICIDNERVTLTLAQGGATKTGDWYVTVA